MPRSRSRSRSPRRRRSRSRSRDRRRRDREEPVRNRSRERVGVGIGGVAKSLPGSKAASSSSVPMTAPPILTEKDLEGKSQVGRFHIINLFVLENTTGTLPYRIRQVNGMFR